MSDKVEKEIVPAVDQLEQTTGKVVESKANDLGEFNVEVLVGQVAELDAKVKAQEKIIAEREAEIEVLKKGSKAEKPKTKPGKGEKLVRFVLSPAGKFKLPYNVGQEVVLHEGIADEVVEAKYAEFVK